MKITTLSRAGNFSNGVTGHVEALRMLAQSFVKGLITAPVAELTDGSTGTVKTALAYVGHFSDTAASGSNLATKAAAEAALGTLKDAVATLFAQATALGSAVGVPNVTYNGGGTVGDASANSGAGDSRAIKAVTKTVAGATTGPTSANTLAVVKSFDVAFYMLGVLVNRLAEATGDNPVGMGNKKTFLSTKDMQYAQASYGPGENAGVLTSTIPAISTDTGTAGASGVSAVDFAAALTLWAGNVATLASALNAITAPAKPRIIAVR